MNTRTTPSAPGTPESPGATRRAPRSAVRELLGLHTREFVRDHRNSVVALVLPLGLGALFLAMAQALPDAESGPGFGQMVMPLVLFLTVSSTPLTSTSGPLAALRTQGSLRLLGTTPVGRARLLLTHMPVRLGLVLAQLSVLIAAGALLGHASLADVPALFGISLLGLLMFGAAGYLVGGVAGGVDSATHTSLFVQLGSMMLSFLFLPLGMLPDTLERVVAHLPPSYLADLFLSLTPAWEPLHPTWLSVLVVLGTAAALTALAIRLFRWDQGERA